MKKISVIIPCYNVASYIDRCMMSIAVQTIGMDALEIICVDDASADGTWARLQAWESLFPENILLIQQDINRRQGAARNVGLAYASAEWVGFVDADDWLEPDYFERLYDSAVQYDCDVVSCVNDNDRDTSDTLVYFDRKSRRTGEDLYIMPDTDTKRKLLIVDLTAGSGAPEKIIRKKLLIDFQIYFPENLAYEDHYWALLLHVYTAGVYVVGERLYHYYANPYSTIASRNETYHMDWVTVQLMKWVEYKKRAILSEYRDELEYDFLRDAVGFLKMLILRYDDPPFSYFQLERQLIREYIPNGGENSYIADFAEVSHMLLKALYAPIDKAGFCQVVRQAKKYWGVLNE